MKRFLTLLMALTMLLALAAGMLVVIYGVDAFQMTMG